jgi:dihydrofolate reductase
MPVVTQSEERTMGRIVVSEFVSLDGVMEDPGGAEGFEFGGWTSPYWNGEVAAFKAEELFASGALLLGRVTYQGFAAAWPAMTDEQGFAERMNSNRKYVVSSTLETAEWNNSTVIRGDLVEEVTRLKMEPGQDILVGGSATLVQGLMRHNLVDEVRLVVYPVVLGKGKRLLTDAGHTNLELVSNKPTATGVVLLTYRPAEQQ